MKSATVAIKDLESALVVIDSLRAELKDAQSLANMRGKSNRVYARDNQRLWAACFRMTGKLERAEKRRAARRAKRLNQKSA